MLKKKKTYAEFGLLVFLLKAPPNPTLICFKTSSIKKKNKKNPAASMKSKLTNPYCDSEFLSYFLHK